MESEKVKEIKKALETCMHTRVSSCRECPYNYTNTKTKHSECFRMAEHALTLINELESENERLMKLQARGGCRVAELGIEIQQLKDQIAELEEGIAQSMLGCEFLPECTNDKLKQFAERLKEHPIMKTYSLHNACERIPKAIDETLNEFIND